MRRVLPIAAFVLTLVMSLAVTPAGAQTPEAATPGATPATTGLASLLPTETEVPDGLIVIQDGGRTLDDVVAGFPDPDEATDRFEAWEWQGNVVRAFHLEDSTTADPDAVDGVYVSIHAFGSPEAASEALEYSADVHKRQDPNVTEQGHDTLGDGSRVLWGEQSYGSEVTIYVQQDSVLIRLSANSPEGDPSDVAWGLIETILAREYFD